MGLEVGVGVIAFASIMSIPISRVVSIVVASLISSFYWLYWTSYHRISMEAEGFTSRSLAGSKALQHVCIGQ